MQSRDAVFIGDVRVRSQREQEPDDIGAPVRGGLEHRAGRADVFRMLCRETPRGGVVHAHARGDEAGQGLQRHGRGAMPFEQGPDLVKAVELGHLVQRPAAVGVDCVGVRAVLQQPGGAAQVVLSHGVAEQIVERPQAEAAAEPWLVVGIVPLRRLARGRRSRPEPLVPARVVADDGGVVERLGVEGLRAAVQQELGQGDIMGVGRLHSFAQPDHPTEHGEGIVPAVVEAGVGIGAGVHQPPGDFEGVVLAGAWDAGIGEIEQGLPVQRARLARRRCRIGAQPTLDLAEVSADDRQGQALAREAGLPLDDPARQKRIPAPAVAKHDVDPFAPAQPPLGHGAGRGLELAPAGQAVLAGEGELDIAQAGSGRGGPQRIGQAGAGLGIARAQRLQPSLGLLAQGVHTGGGGELAAHGTFLPSSPGVR